MNQVMKRITNTTGLLGYLGLLTFSAVGANAHGEDRPGPNGGVIRMPGAFHVEVKLEKPGSFRIYLLDMDFKNSMVENSEVKAVIVRGQKRADLECVKRGGSFSCQVPRGGLAESGELVVTAMRAGMQGNEALYPLPLKVSTTKVVPMPVDQGHSPKLKQNQKHGHGHH